MDSERIRFYLKRPKEDGPTAIIMKTEINHEPFKYYVGKSLHPELWNIKTGYPTTDTKTIAEWRKQDPHIKLNLDNLKTRIALITNSKVSFVNLKEQANEEFSHEDLKLYLDSRWKQISPQPRTTGVLDFIERYLSEMISGNR